MVLISQSIYIIFSGGSNDFIQVSYNYKLYLSFGMNPIRLYTQPKKLVASCQFYRACQFHQVATSLLKSGLLQYVIC